MSTMMNTYDINEFKNPLFTVDSVLFTVKNDALKVLMVKRANEPFFNSWGLPGGFVDVVHMPMALRTRTLPRHFPGDPSIGLARRAIPGACGLLHQRMMEASDVPRI